MGAPGFQITTNYHGPSQYQAAVLSAAAALESVIVGDLRDVTSPQYGLIDDILIDVNVLLIDGPDGTLANAGPDEGLHRVDGHKLPSHGTLTVDTADIASLAADGTLVSTLIHEMLHVLGFGTYWDFLGLTEGTSYIGSFALAQYRALSGNPSATAIPLEIYEGAGSDFSHWRENVFLSEIMSSQAGPGTVEPLSAMTIAALMDLGYTVSFASAAPYQLPRIFAEAPIQWKGKKGDDEFFGGAGNDILKGKKGHDSLYGDFGDDRLDGGKGNDYLDGQFGNDTVLGGKGDDSLFGDFGADFLSGGKGSDYLNGEDGADTLFGGKGNDFVKGGTGNDVMTGNKGSDTFIFALGFGFDTVTDFRHGTDKLEFILPGITYAGQITASLVQLAGGTLIDLGANDVFLQNVTTLQVSISDILIG